MSISLIKRIRLAEPGVEVEKLANGGMILRSPQLLGLIPQARALGIEQWAAKTPDTVPLLSGPRPERTGTGGKITYDDFLNKVRAIRTGFVEQRAFPGATRLRVNL